MEQLERHNLLWSYLESFPENVLNHVSISLALTPAEKQTSFASYDFDNPVPSDF